MQLTDWQLDPDAPHCAMRCRLGADPRDVATRVAFIEKTPRVRIAPFDNDVDDWKNWEQGPKGCAPEYGTYAPSRAWCDARLRELGYSFDAPPRGG